MNKNKVKFWSFIISYWIFGLILYYLLPNIRGWESGFLNIILWPFTSITGIAFISAGIPFILAFIVAVICEIILKRRNSIKLIIVFYGIVIPALFWSSVYISALKFTALYPHGI